MKAIRAFCASIGALVVFCCACAGIEWLYKTFRQRDNLSAENSDLKTALRQAHIDADALARSAMKNTVDSLRSGRPVSLDG